MFLIITWSIFTLALGSNLNHNQIIRKWFNRSIRHTIKRVNENKGYLCVVVVHVSAGPQKSGLVCCGPTSVQTAAEEVDLTQLNRSRSEVDLQTEQ